MESGGGDLNQGKSKKGGPSPWERGKDTGLIPGTRDGSTVKGRGKEGGETGGEKRKRPKHRRKKKGKKKT